MSSEPRRVLGFLITPFVGGLAAFLCFPAFEWAGRASWGGFPSSMMDAAVAFGFGTFLVATIVTVFGAVPAFAWLYRRGAVSFRQTLISGVLLGNAPFALAVVGIVIVQIVKGDASPDIGRNWYGASGAARTIALGSVVGLVSASVFWVVALRTSAPDVKPSD
jgi:hypothetical protein